MSIQTPTRPRRSWPILALSLGIACLVILVIVVYSLIDQPKQDPFCPDTIVENRTKSEYQTCLIEKLIATYLRDSQQGSLNNLRLVQEEYLRHELLSTAHAELPVTFSMLEQEDQQIWIEQLREAQVKVRALATTSFRTHASRADVMVWTYEERVVATVSKRDNVLTLFLTQGVAYYHCTEVTGSANTCRLSSIDIYKNGQIRGVNVLGFATQDWADQIPQST